ncbi:PhzF family phenazine biosynthesis protein [Acidaminococcus massiliensis]|uniref:PhzF family phenazine biosynthesis protein n=1 Tax=Acidaminococcus massiliensis TaxID=1852375 RepID=UPI00248DD5E8|nr:PhzF family phenazine biosynthesis isomerase [Acidaminococcus massiliensis]
MEQERSVTMKTFHTVAFQYGPGGGNSCPVTLEADGLTGEQMQQMTFQFQQEAAFLLSPTAPGCDVKPRYFVPLHEMEMCVHATVASAMVLVDQGIIQHSPIVFESHYGPLPVEWERKDGEILIRVEQFLPKFQAKRPSDEELCRVLGIPQEALGKGPVESAATSRMKLMVPLAAPHWVHEVKPDFSALWDLCDRCETTGFYIFAPENNRSDNVVFHARQFPNRSGYNEDPATGVAASALGAYLVRHQLIPVAEGWNPCTVYQGEAMGRPSLIRAETQVTGGKITKTRICGTACYEK